MLYLNLEEGLNLTKEGRLFDPRRSAGSILKLAGGEKKPRALSDSRLTRQAGREDLERGGESRRTDGRRFSFGKVKPLLL